MMGFNIVFATAATFIAIVFVAVVVTIIINLVRSGARAAQNQASPEVAAQAQVVDKRTLTTGGGESPVRQEFFVTFQQVDGVRFELAVPAAEYGLLVVGDHGTVSMKGTRYLGFARELMR